MLCYWFLTYKINLFPNCHYHILHNYNNIFIFFKYNACSFTFYKTVLFKTFDDAIKVVNILNVQSILLAEIQTDFILSRKQVYSCTPHTIAKNTTKSISLYFQTNYVNKSNNNFQQINLIIH